MIFVTVGTQAPFDRLIRVVDRWAARLGRGDVFAQIGDTEFRPEHIAAAANLEPDEFALRLSEAEVVVGHAGMGTIISAVELGKPVLVMPRREELRETRGDHQMATAQRFKAKSLVHVAMDEEELVSILERIDELRPLGSVDASAAPELLDAIRTFVRRSS